MRIALSKAIAAWALIPTVTAFYPYEQADGDVSKVRRAAADSPPHVSPSSRPRGSPRSLTLPLRRTPIRPRDNNYGIVKSTDPRPKNSVAVDQDGQDISYVVEVTFGSSKKVYHLLLDSAASNTWVMGQGCTTEACEKHNLFGEGDSDSLKVRVSSAHSAPVEVDNANRR